MGFERVGHQSGIISNTRRILNRMLRELYSRDTFSSLKIGDSENYTQFDESGILTLVGDARVYDQKWMPFNELKAPGTKPATFKEWGISGAWEFSDATDDTIVFAFAVPLNMDRSASPIIKIGWSTTTVVTTETAVWQLEYLYTAPGDDTTAAAQDTLKVNSNAISQSNGFIIAEFEVMDLVSAADICIHGRLKRLGADVADDLTDTAELHGVCFRYLSNKRGE